MTITTVVIISFFTPLSLFFTNKLAPGQADTGEKAEMK